MKIQEIKITKFPVIIFTDSHTNLTNLKKRWNRDKKIDDLFK